jgi:hypothetical protein
MVKNLTRRYVNRITELFQENNQNFMQNLKESEISIATNILQNWKTNGTSFSIKIFTLEEKPSNVLALPDDPIANHDIKYHTWQMENGEHEIMGIIRSFKFKGQPLMNMNVSSETTATILYQVFTENLGCLLSEILLVMEEQKNYNVTLGSFERNSELRNNFPTYPPIPTYDPNEKNEEVLQELQDEFVRRVLLYFNALKPYVDWMNEQIEQINTNKQLLIENLTEEAGEFADKIASEIIASEI